MATIDLSDETEPEERLAEQDEQMQRQLDRIDENDREAGHNGTVTVEDFDVQEVLDDMNEE